MPDAPEVAPKRRNWEAAIIRNRGKPAPTLGNAVLILSHHPDWVGVLAYDAFVGKVRVLKPPPVHQLDTGAPGDFPCWWSDEMASHIAIWVERYYEGCALTLETTTRAVRKAAERCAYHPVQDYLTGLDWDKTPRLDTWLSDHLRVEDNPYVRAVGAKWMISAVARAMAPGCQVDYVLVIEGAQRGGKSSAIKALCHDPLWFLETGVELGHKDAYQVIRAKWIVELAELDSLSRSEASRVKMFLSSKVDTYRPSYGREVVDQLRSVVFAATTNDWEYLKDDSGGARFWPVFCPATQADRLDTTRLIAARDQLWAEATARYRAGEPWHLTDPAIIEMAECEQERRRQSDPWEEAVGELLRDKVAQKEGVSASQVLAALGLDPTRATKADSMRAARALRRAGWAHTATPRKDGRQVKIYRPKV